MNIDQLSELPRLGINPDMVIVGREDCKVIYWDTSSGCRYALPEVVADALERIRDSSALPAGFGTDALSLLREKGMLVEQSARPAALSPAATAHDLPRATGSGLFGYQRMKLADALRDVAIHGVVVGMPYDAGVTARPGARFGPWYIRTASRTVFRSSPATDSAGMFDPVRGRYVLNGVGVADVGDVSAVVHSRNADTMDELSTIVSAIACAGKVPIVLGGDHSITLPSARALLSNYPALGIIHFDAHPDYRRSRTGDWRPECHHGNFMDWLVGDQRIHRVVQFGVRQLIAEPVEPHPKLVVWPGISACSAGLEAVLDTVPATIPYYVTVDVDVLDPAYMPSTGAPLPGGFIPHQLIDLIDGLCAARHVIGLDIVEYMPDGHTTSAPAVAEILLRLMDGALTGPVGMQEE